MGLAPLSGKSNNKGRNSGTICVSLSAEKQVLRIQRWLHPRRCLVLRLKPLQKQFKRPPENQMCSSRTSNICSRNPAGLKFQLTFFLYSTPLREGSNPVEPLLVCLHHQTKDKHLDVDPRDWKIQHGKPGAWTAVRKFVLLSGLGTPAQI